MYQLTNTLIVALFHLVKNLSKIKVDPGVKDRGYSLK